MAIGNGHFMQYKAKDAYGADAQQCSISTIVRRFVAAGLAAGGLFVLSALIEITIARRTGAGAPWAAKES